MDIHAQPTPSFHPNIHLPLGADAPWLAPLAGYSDLPFRLLCRAYGAACAVSEMVSAKGLMYKSSGTKALLQTSPADAPLVVQLYGAEPEIVGRAMDELLARGFGWFDLNAGCPVPKVAKAGCGAAMLRDAQSRANLRAVVQTMVERAGPGRVGVKLRRGWTRGDDVYLELGPELEDLGAAWLTLHPRWARQGFAGEADWACIGRLVAAVRIPVLASGDLHTAADGLRCQKETGAAGLMFARGALADPAIFLRYCALRRGESSCEDPTVLKLDLLRLIRRHIAFSRTASVSDHLALLKMRSFIPRYLRSVPGARALRKNITSCTEWDQLDALLNEFLVS